jgi:hypothetical protein
MTGRKLKAEGVKQQEMEGRSGLLGIFVVIVIVQRRGEVGF